MSETAHATHTRQAGTAWPAMRVALHVGAVVLNGILFAVLAFELRDGSSGLAWTMAAAIALVALAQAVLLLLSRRQASPEASEGMQGDDWEEAQGDAWDEAPDQWAATDDEPAPGDAWQEETRSHDAWSDEQATGARDDDVYTVGCPSCGTAFTVTAEMVDRGEIHCVNCGVGGHVGSEDLDRDSVHAVTCQGCSDVYQAHTEASTCPACGVQNEDILA